MPHSSVMDCHNRRIGAWSWLSATQAVWLVKSRRSDHAEILRQPDVAVSGTALDGTVCGSQGRGL